MQKENKKTDKAIWCAITLITLCAIVLVSRFSPFIADYDGLMYFDTAKTMNGWLFSPGNYKIAVNHANDFVYFWPISNALSVFIASIFYYTVNLNFLPLLINSIYLFLFVAYLKKIRPHSYAYVAILFLCGHTLFFRLFTTLTSEFSVGLWIFAFLLTLISNHERRGSYLAALTVLGLLLRTIDLVFILMAVSAYAFIHYYLWRNKQHIVVTLRYVGLALILTAPLFFQHYQTAFKYVYNVSFGATAESWKSLGGVSDRSDVILKYVSYLFLYNPLVIPVVVCMTGFCFYSRLILNKSIVLVVGISLSVCLPLVLASSLNIQIVFWIYTALIFIVCELGFLLYCGLPKKVEDVSSVSTVRQSIFLTAITLGSVFFLARSWSHEVPYLRQQRDVSKIAFDISKVLDIDQGTPVLAYNYRGVGALDSLGLAWRRESSYSYGGIRDIYSKNRKPDEYIEVDKSTNFFIAAHENYFFAPHFGINDHIKETHRLFSEKSPELGFKRAQQISRDGKTFDMWYRPSARAHLQYASFGDTWISWGVPVEIGSPKLCAGDHISGVLNFTLDFQNPNLPSYAPPFLITVRSESSDDVLSSAVVNKYGMATVALTLKNISCGKYNLSIDKAFSTKFDPRELSAQFVKLESAFKFDIKQMSK